MIREGALLLDKRIDCVLEGLIKVPSSGRTWLFYWYRTGVDCRYGAAYEQYGCGVSMKCKLTAALGGRMSLV